MADPVSLRLVRRFLTLLVLLYPPGFRTAVGGHLRQLLHDRAREEARRGTAALLLFCLSNVVACTRDAVLEWLKRDGAGRTAQATRVRPTKAARVSSVDGLALDLFVAKRQLLRRPAFSLVVVGVLALGVGFGVSVLTVVDAVLYRPLPYRNADSVVWIRGVLGDFDGYGVSPANWLDWKDMQRSFSTMAATRGVNAPLLDGGADYVGTLHVESAFFRILGVSPHLGRLLGAEDDRPDAPRVAVLTHQLWAARFGADRSLLGQEITLAGRLTTVVGILPPSFAYVDWPVWGGPDRHVFSNDVYRGDRTSRLRGGTIWPVALLGEGVTVAQAGQDMDRVADDLAEAYPDINGTVLGRTPLGIKVTPLRRALTQEVRGSVLLLGGFVVLLVLVVCVNVAGLFLARTVDRRRELAIRASLGANGVRLARETLAQVALLTLLGGATGLGLAAVILRGIHALSPPNVVFLDHARLDGRVALGSAGLAVAMWMLAGVLPALRAGRIDVNATLKAGGTGGPPNSSRVSRAIIVVQLGLATTLLMGAGLLLSTYASMAGVDPGVRVDDVRVLGYRLPTDRYARADGTMADYETAFPDISYFDQLGPSRVYRVGAEARTFVDRAVTRLRAIPGVVGVAVANYPPLWGYDAGYTVKAVDPDEEALQYPSVGRYRVKWVSNGYFDVMGLRLRRGRVLSEADGSGAEAVIVVNQAFVDTYLRTVLDPLGAVVPVLEAGYFPPRHFTVVGVVDDVLHGNPSQPEVAAAYISIAQRGELWQQSQVGAPLLTTFLVRVDPEVGPSQGVLREAISELDGTLVIRTSTTLEALYDELSREARFWLALLSAFGVVAILVAAAGTFALQAQAVRHRTREIAVRRTLGATARVVLGRVVKDAVALAATGLFLGLAASWYLSRLLAAQVVGVEGMEVIPAVAVVCVFLAAAVTASWIPARWASRVDPVEALRVE